MNRKPLTLVILAFAAGFGAVMATRLDASAIAAVLGAVCALAFGVPVTILVTALILQQRMKIREMRQSREIWRPQQQPPVVIVPPAQIPQLGHGSPWAPMGREVGQFSEFPPSRDFTVIGEEVESE